MKRSLTWCLKRWFTTGVQQRVGAYKLVVTTKCSTTTASLGAGLNAFR